MLNFVPNVSECLVAELDKAERVEHQARAWLRKHKSASFTQSLCLTPGSALGGRNRQRDFLHSVHVLPNQYSGGELRSSGKPAPLFCAPEVSVARRCHVCNDPFCPNISILNRSVPAESGETGLHYPSKKDVTSASVSKDVRKGNNSSLLNKICDKETCADKPSPQSPGVGGETFSRKVFSSDTPVGRTSGSNTTVKGINSAARKLFQDQSDREKTLLSGPSSNAVPESVDQWTSVDYPCCRGGFHAHTFPENKTERTPTADSKVKEMASGFSMNIKYGHRSMSRQQAAFSHSSHSSQSNPFNHSGGDNQRNICLTFWKPALSFCPYSYGDQVVDFGSLWPDEASLQRTMSEVCQDTVLRRAVLDMCKLSLRCGPLRLLKALLALKLLNLDQVFEDGSGMLHLALIARNVDATNFLCHAGISPKIRDKFGHTADQVCFSPKLRKSIPQRYLNSTGGHVARSATPLILPGRHDTEGIFYLAKSYKNFDELQKKLQTFQFDVNGQSNSTGDYLVHIVTRAGLSQFPMLLTLVRIQGADIELSNLEGMSPLMIAAQNGDAVLCDVLLCLLGCNPNKPNPHNGRYALHYACASNSAEVVNCLLNRGADFNLEDFSGCRPDDTAMSRDCEDCRQILSSRRQQRSQFLTSLIKTGEPFQSNVRYTDLYVVDDNGRTLIMAAAQFNRVDHLETLLAVEGSPIDAQHAKNGQTALSIAAQTGNMEAVRVLLSHDVNPTIRDLHGYLPLHYAVMNSHNDVLETMLEFFPKTYTGLLLASKLTVNSVTHQRIKAAMLRRKDEIVTPELYDCALTGDAERLYRVLEDGDSVNLRRGAAPIFLAVENGHLDVVKLLYERGADISRRHPTTSATVLHAAAKMGHTHVVEFLLQICRHPTPPVFSLMDKRRSRPAFTPYKDLYGSYYKELDINALDGDDKTPLLLAADKGYSSIIKLLLDHGATTALLNNQGELITCSEYDGVRIMIENYRQNHMIDVMKCVMDRKGLNQLKQVWLPRFDHNLRDRGGNTPLMVACRTGRLEVVSFLLESAVYVNSPLEEENSNDSDADSGLDRASNRTPSNVKGDTGEDSSCRDSQGSQFAPTVIHPEGGAEGGFLSSPQRPVSVPPGMTFSSRDSQGWVHCVVENTPRPTGFHPTHRVSDVHVESRLLQSSAVSMPPEENEMMMSNHKYVMSKLMSDLERPIGLSILHDKRTCHLCALNPYDGNTALHRAIEGGDNPQLVQMLLNKDAAVSHIQNFMGYSPLHLACKLNRKKTVQLLLTVPGLDIHCLTADGKQPEDLCSSKSVRKLLVKARTDNPIDERLHLRDSPASSPSASSYGDTATTINFERIGDQYKTLKKNYMYKAK